MSRDSVKFEGAGWAAFLEEQPPWPPPRPQAAEPSSLRGHPRWHSFRDRLGWRKQSRRSWRRCRLQGQSAPPEVLESRGAEDVASSSEGPRWRAEGAASSSEL